MSTGPPSALYYICDYNHIYNIKYKALGGPVIVRESAAELLLSSKRHSKKGDDTHPTAIN